MISFAKTKRLLPKGYKLAHDENPILFMSNRTIIVRCEIDASYNPENDENSVHQYFELNSEEPSEVENISNEGPATIIEYKSKFKRRNSQCRTVILKMPNTEYPSESQLMGLERDYEISKYLLTNLSTRASCDYVLDVYEKVNLGKTIVLVKEDFDAINLYQYLQKEAPNGQMELKQFVQMAMRLCDIVSALHSLRVLHLDIKPHNILYNADRGMLKICDFSLSAITSINTPYVRSALPMGSYHYMPPEQSGKVTQNIDARSDIYSLGCTFYHLLAGRPPFQEKTTTRLMYSHMAKSPEPLYFVNSKAPIALDLIIRKMMNKRPAERYQYVRTIKKDLEYCWQFINKDEPIPNTFLPTSAEVSDIFALPTRIYGRAGDIAHLESSLDSINMHNTMEIVFIKGAAGVGKSQIVHEFYKRNVDDIIFVTGKFEQFLSTPHLAIVSVMRTLVDMTLGQMFLMELKGRLLEAMEGKGKVIADLIPNFSLIVGEQQSLPALGAKESAERFMSVAVAFFKVYAEMGKPLCIFLDDMQWSDSGSLQLIERLFAVKNLRMLMICSFRDSGAAETKCLQSFVDKLSTHPVLEKREVKKPHVLTIHPLKEKDVCAFVQDTLHTTGPKVEELATLVFSKTAGNPLFVRQFMTSIYLDQLVKWDYFNDKWTWDNAAIRQANYTENVVTFMLGRLKSFSERCKEILKYASCIGNSFTVHEIAAASGKKESEVREVLLEAKLAGWIMEIPNSTIKFMHDQLREACTHLMTPEEEANIHFKFGRAIMQHRKQYEGDNIFEVMNHLSFNISHYMNPKTPEEEWLEYLQLSIEAIKKSLNASAITQAHTYCVIAKQVLFSRISMDDPWPEKYFKLMFDIHILHVEAYRIAKKLDEAESLLRDLVKHTSHDKPAYVHCVAATLSTLNTMNKFDEAYDDLREFFMKNSELTMNFPINGKSQEIKAWIFKMMSIIQPMINEKLDSMQNLPEMEDETSYNLLSLFLEAIPIFYIATKADKSMLSAVAILCGYIILTKGKSPMACLLGAFGIGYFLITKDINTSLKLAAAGVEICKQFKHSTCYTIARLFYGFLSIPHGTLESQRRVFEEVFVSGVKSSEYTWAGFAGFYVVLISVLNGNNIDHTIKLMHRVDSFLESTQARITKFLAKCVTPLIRILKAQTDAYTGGDLEEVKATMDQREPYAFLAALAHYFLGDYEKSYDFITIARRHSNDFWSLSLGCALPFWQAIIAGELIDHLKKQNQGTERVSKLIRRLKTCSQEMQALHQKYDQYVKAMSSLIVAEVLKQQNNDVVHTIKAYETAIEEANATACNMVGAIASKRLALYLVAQGFGDRFISAIASDSLKAWKRMGAIRLHNELLEQFRAILPTEYSAESETIGLSNYGEAGSTAEPPVVMAEVKRAARIIASDETQGNEFELAHVFINLMPLIAEHMGAERTCLLIHNKKEDFFTFEAEILSKQSSEEDRPKKLLAESENLLSLSIVNRVIRSKNQIIVENACDEPELMQDKYIVTKGIRSIMCVPVFNHTNGALDCVFYFENNSIVAAFTEQKLNLLRTIVDVAVENAIMFHSLNSSYARFLPQEFLHQLGKKSVLMVQAGDAVEKNMTVMFSDIRNFTSITEKLTAKSSFSFINQFLRHIAPPIDENHGFIDKFIGDSVMAIFPYNTTCALQAAIGMLQALNSFNTGLDLEHSKKQKIDIGIGIAYGPVMLGTVGYKARLNATVISDTVNIASRLESLTKALGVRVLVTRQVIDEYEIENLGTTISNDSKNGTTDTNESEIGQTVSSTSSAPLEYSIQFRAVGKFYLKGKHIAYELYEVYDPQWESHFPISKLQEFNTALHLFYTRNFYDASSKIKQLLNLYPGDLLLQFYDNVIEQYQKLDLPPTWAGEIKIDKDGALLQLEEPEGGVVTALSKPTVISF